ncbi:MAG: M23 family metallopeptidase [Christensenella sp.]|nr:M23 family metallopeptidase [Christensenella sp.]
MDKKFLNRIFLFVAAGVLLSLGVIGALRAARPSPQTGPVMLEEAPAEMVSVDTIQPTPAPTLEPVSYQNTVTLLVDRVPLMTLSSELAAKQMLWEYLSSTTAPEGEKFLSARFDCELILTPGDPYIKPLDASEALEMLSTNPTLVPIRVTTLRTQVSRESPQISSSEEGALPKGERIITQLGTGAETETSVRAVYRAGVLLETGAPLTTTLREARATILRTGTYAKKDPSGAPDRLEGPEGKSKGTLKLGYPMRGQLTGYFGYTNGKMNYGLNIMNVPGTNIVAPGEGVVIYSKERGAYGYVVDIDHGNGFVSRLTHLKDVQVELNQRVFQGDKIGTLAEDEDGDKATFHYEVIVDGIPYNPLYYID